VWKIQWPSDYSLKIYEKPGKTTRSEGYRRKMHTYMYAYVGRAVTTKACLMAIITDFSQPQRKRQQRHPFWPAAGRLMAGE